MEKNKVLEMRNKQDILILATKILESMDAFVTGDKDFVVLNIETSKILTMKEFLEKY